MKKWQLTVTEIALFALLGGLMFASKLAMSSLPNIHLIALFIMAVTTVYRVKAIASISVYILLEGIFFGFTAWWVPYLYIWFILWGAVMLIPKKVGWKPRMFIYPVLGLLHGLLFGTLFSPMQALFFHLNFKQTLAWIAAGFPYDLVHGISNFVIGFLTVPLAKLMMTLDLKLRSSRE